MQVAISLRKSDSKPYRGARGKHTPKCNPGGAIAGAAPPPEATQCST